EFLFSFLLSSRLYLRPHELLGKLLSSVPDSESLESLVALLAEWTNKFPYDYRDERMMSHVKHIVARCSNTRLEAVVSEILSALLKRLTNLEIHEEELRACQATTVTPADKSDTKLFSCPTSTQYAQILCRIEKKLAKHIGPEEFVQCSSNVLLDKQLKHRKAETALSSDEPMPLYALQLNLPSSLEKLHFIPFHKRSKASGGWAKHP
uniref:N-terminal Ras-GEF domain-containing protein n=1 Tax=Stomoxys calcitrans TaxID=35570 RepID=A0A1I8Q4A5_STOCA